ncbi:MAG TPA: 2-phosphosulfolactate phosphatase [Candidatus Acidoferrum sp.]|nr:2-phosphosulfolactate phosphatase [Candidatus Acidoferrum sp.]
MVIDFLPESVHRYHPGWAIVAVDVIRATTTAITAAATGRRCFPAPNVEAALTIARRFSNPLLAGESSGTMPIAFEMDNSPSQLAARSDTHRPLVLVSSSGTKVIHEAAGCEAVYLGCFRSHSRLVGHLASRHARVAVIGAGSKGEFREEDQICCAWIAAGLMSKGYQAGSPQTTDVVSRWRDAPPAACLCSRSVAFLRRTGQLSDLDFILGHIDDLPGVFEIRNGEVRMIPSTARTHRGRRQQRRLVQ